jgi:hypothetical protein
MSESSEQKTIRKFIKLLENPDFSYQITIFYNNSFDKSEALKHKPIITRLIGKIFPKQPFLYRLALNSRVESENLDDLKSDAELGEVIVMPYHTLFTNQVTEIKLLEERLKERLQVSLRVKRKVFTDSAKVSYIRAVRKGKPHDLEGFFPKDSNIKRIALFGKSFLS